MEKSKNQRIKRTKRSKVTVYNLYCPDDNSLSTSFSLLSFCEMYHQKRSTHDKLLVSVTKSFPLDVAQFEPLNDLSDSLNE